MINMKERLFDRGIIWNGSTSTPEILLRRHPLSSFNFNSFQFKFNSLNSFRLPSPPLPLFSLHSPSYCFNFLFPFALPSPLELSVLLKSLAQRSKENRNTTATIAYMYVPFSPPPLILPPPLSTFHSHPHRIGLIVMPLRSVSLSAEKTSA